MSDPRVYADETNARFAILAKYELLLTDFSNYRTLKKIHNKEDKSVKSRINSYILQLWERVKNYSVVIKNKNYENLKKKIDSDVIFNYSEMFEFVTFFSDSLHNLGILNLQYAKKDPGNAMRHYA